MTALSQLLATYRAAAVTEREKGTYFEELILTYLRNEATYRDLYSQVWTWADWAPGHGFTAKDDGIDLVAQLAGTGEFHAIQCKFYDPDYKLQKKDIDSFFTASGRKPFTHRIIVSSTDHWSDHAENALVDQQPPVSKITLHDLEGSQIDWARYQPRKAPVLKAKKTLLPHQETALKEVTAGLKEADRGKLIMACGTGKTFTSLKIAEAMAGKGKRVLFLVPSLSLLSQTLTEWTQESGISLHSFAVCSDSDVGKKRGRKEDDAVQTLAHELRYPATTDAKRLAQGVALRHDDEHMTVVFSTYHSIEVIHDAQQAHGLPDFDLIVCDEAHRTTGATFEGDDESAFVRVHDASYIRSTKRMYMTATPRIYGDSAKAVAERDNVALYSMDNEAWYGKQLFLITFSEAVKRGLLVDYKVIVLAVEESHINRRLQKLLADENNQLKVDDAAKIVGCWKALAKLGIHEDGTDTPEPMKRAVAFCQVIEPGKGGKTHKVSSKEIAGMFQAVVEAYQDAEDIEEGARLTCEAEHVDGGMNAGEKEAKLDWLKAPTPADTCRVLSNVRCLSEGVDVPALDAVLFLTPRNSQVDVVQSVGRVMRTVKDKNGNHLKKRGYVVLPVVIPAGIEPHEALNDNKTYAVVWQVLQALRSHDDRFDAMVNKLDLVGPDRSKMEVIAIADTVQRKASPLRDNSAKQAGKAKGKFAIGESAEKYGPAPDQTQLEFEVGEIERALYAKVVDKCGNRHHWEDWANDIARIAQTHIDRIKALLEDPDQTAAREAFNEFAKELRDDLNDKVSDAEIIEMLAQHLITKPVFEALFADYSFANHNPMSRAMQRVLDVLHEQHLDKEASTLQEFYDSVKMRAEGIDSPAGKQKIIKELYDKFFNGAFPNLAKRLGIVYTPIEVVDFILHSVDHLLRQEFGQTLGSEGVHILDPFTGTGTFITRLLQSGLISQDQLSHKYKHEIHANELVLLAYYIAAINIEATYHGIAGGDYVPFEGICLTDTFQMYEKDDLLSEQLVDNSKRRKRQKKLDIRVIVGNPPYSVGQDSQNDNNQNIGYPALDKRIEETYAARSVMTSVRNLYDSYIRSIRWASDRIGEAGIIGFVTNAGFLDATSQDGMRKCLVDEFSSLYVFHLRGNQRTSGETSRKEGGKIFGSGSRAPIAISLLVKNPQAAERGQIFFHDIGDYLSREEKLEKIAGYFSVAGVPDWGEITPDDHGDWLKQRDDSFSRFIVLGDKKGDSLKLFDNFSLGVATGRDAWAYNASRDKLGANMAGMIGFYNAELARFDAEFSGKSKKQRDEAVDGFIDTDATQISWTRALKQELGKGRPHAYDEACRVTSLYRPFTKQWLYFNRRFNEMVYQMPRIFPTAATENLVIAVSGAGAMKEFTTLISSSLLDLCSTDIRVSQCFPLYLYDEVAQQADEGLFGSGESVSRRDSITDAGLVHFQSAYAGEAIGKEDLFYYIYGILHSPDYRARYADNLSKELPRIPRVKLAADFWAFSKAGRALARLHLNYDTVEKCPLIMEAKSPLTDADYRVEKMKFAKKKDPETGKNVDDRSTVIYNTKITLKGIPEAAWEYVVNGKAALDWVMERQAVRVDKASGIVNDANDWAVETIGNSKYPLELFQRVVTVSLETQKIVANLPALDIRDDG
ncbi:DEAD/DEAH box helicase [Lysobacter antibioticus]|uniref:DEAD/DEAH box helicase family protein n=1 Tax=Lysobacter antibioticus TaxID=84531 RepID=A0A0S2F530_LYSAN|nr:type ISP restriction/modification enzyme [Lysobacter antibioticus]ALN78635.1 DEAD/DEAH box helicase family protein [Lysobacter antibioticus]